MEDSGARRTSGTRARAASFVLVLMAVPLLSSCGGDGVDLPSATGSLTATGLPSVTGSLPDRTRSPSREESQPATTESSRTSDPTTTQPTESTEPESSTPTSEPPTSEPPTSAPSSDTTPATTTPSEATSATASTSPKDKGKDKAKGKDAEDDGVPPWVWWLLAAAGLAAAALAAFLVPRARRRKAWTARMADAEAEATWFARELLPQLQQAASPDEVAGGWQVASGRVVAAEDELTGLATTAPDEAGSARANELRDAVRTARGGVEDLLVSRDPATFRRELAAIATGLADALSPPAPQP